MRKTKNKQEGGHKTTQAGHSGNPFMVSGCLWTAFYQVIRLGANSSRKLPHHQQKIHSLHERSASCVGGKHMCAISALPLCYAQSDCFSF